VHPVLSRVTNFTRSTTKCTDGLLKGLFGGRRVRRGSAEANLAAPGLTL
jgi:hypothetical protein